ncbi:hypothetical protein K1T71_012894 [Dendrolimus kikuchii]|uniref:Uncharacterized protein n=1 Tax=Dendrolimus kikuchii TaxID=765133 RepID=A0ACC1CID7_9NEOP|nr:hypothetical protein K1T71_012894 [Dendrolimus kikuchii]
MFPGHRMSAVVPWISVVTSTFIRPKRRPALLSDCDPLCFFQDLTTLDLIN